MHPFLTEKKLSRLAGHYWLLVLLVLLTATLREGQQYRAWAVHVSGVVSGTIETGRRRIAERPLFQYTVDGTGYRGWTRNADYPEGARVKLLVNPDDPTDFTVDDGYFRAEIFIGKIDWLVGALLLFGGLMALVVRARRRFRALQAEERVSRE